ncbi:CBS domain-containing protein [Candidatus Micrarchaeota archaeon]|nr:CBS domain-containing protein [Candidatus Micrarchaeota archaeon]
MRIETAVCVEENESLSKAIGYLKETDFLIMTRKGKYAGEITANQLVWYTGDARATKAATVARKGTVMYEPLNDDHILQKFAEGRIEGAAVLDERMRVRGILNKKNILELAESYAELKTSKVRDVMTPAYTIDKDSTIDQANRLMTRNRLQQLVVTEGKKAVGKFSELDMVRNVKPYLHQSDRSRTVRAKMDVEKERVQNVMSALEDTDYIAATDSLAEAAEKLRMRNECIPLIVIDQGKLKGLIGFHEVIQMLAPRPESKVTIVGLKEEGKFSKRSIEEEARKLLKRVGGEGHVQLHVKSKRKGKHRKEYEVAGRLRVDGEEVYANPSRLKHRNYGDLHQGIKDALDALQRIWERRIRK